jgi:FkbM family methyltransferase
LNNSKIIEINNYRLYTIPCDEGLSKELLVLKDHEPVACRQLQKVLMSGMVCLDIGSNIGYYAVLERMSVGENGKVLAIEPSPIAYSYLNKNISLNHLDIQTFELAISDNNGFVPFLRDKCSNLSHIVTEVIKQSDGKVMYVPAKTLDSFVKDNGLIKLDLIRMDVEGHEEKILSNAKVTLQKFKPYILVEIHLYQIGLEGFQNLFRMFKETGYTVKYYIPRELELLDFFGKAKKWDICGCTIDQLLQRQLNDQLPDYFTLLLECVEKNIPPF